LMSTVERVAVLKQVPVVHAAEWNLLHRPRTL
jgi:hypothetical protein